MRLADLQCEDARFLNEQLALLLNSQPPLRQFSNWREAAQVSQ